MSEDLLKYVPKEGSGEFPVTTAINVAQEQKETEVNRELKEQQPGKEFYVDLVTLQGELKVRNFEKTPITVGDHGAHPRQTNIGVRRRRHRRGHRQKLQIMERAGSIKWNVNRPGKTEALTYKYERYVPSRWQLSKPGTYWGRKQQR